MHVFVQVMASPDRTDLNRRPAHRTGSGVVNSSAARVARRATVPTPPSPSAPLHGKRQSIPAWFFNPRMAVSGRKPRPAPFLIVAPCRAVAGEPDRNSRAPWRVGRLHGSTAERVTSKQPSLQKATDLRRSALFCNVRISIAIFSYSGGLYFGVTGDYDSSNDIGVLPLASRTRWHADRGGCPSKHGLSPAPRLTVCSTRPCSVGWAESPASAIGPSAGALHAP